MKYNVQEALGDTPHTLTKSQHDYLRYVLDNNMNELSATQIEELCVILEDGVYKKRQRSFLNSLKELI